MAMVACRFFRRPAAMASRTYARKGPMPADVTQDVDMDTQPLTAREVRTQVRPSQFAAAYVPRCIYVIARLTACLTGRGACFPGWATTMTWTSA
jgi:hypothetical protein